MLHVVILVFAAIVIIVVFGFMMIDAADKVEWLKTKVPWFEKVLAKRHALTVLALTMTFLLIADGYELYTKEVPEVPAPPIVKIPPPPAPIIEEKPPKVIIRTLPAPEQEKKCWVANHFGLPNSKIDGAITATAAIMHCNYKIEAPFVVQVEFDRDFIPGTMVLPESGVTMREFTGKQGKVFIGKITAPSLVSEQLVIVTAYGRTDQFPRSEGSNKITELVTGFE
jgi:hypothetical protein